MRTKQLSNKRKIGEREEEGKSERVSEEKDETSFRANMIATSS